jgi:hypothetical protein
MATFTLDGSRLVCARPYVDGSPVFVRSSGTLPAPLTSTVARHVRDSDGASFALAATPGGAAIALSSEGEGVHVVRPEVVTVDGGELAEDVADWFALEGSSTVVVFGHREGAKQTNQGAGRANRITIVPGDETGKAGAIASARLGGRHRRQFATWAEALTFSVWGFDASRPNDERAQYSATRALFSQLVEAIRKAQCGRVAISGVKWSTAPSERSFGRSLSFVVSIQSPMVRHSSTLRTVVRPPAQPSQVDPGTMLFFSSEVTVFPAS